MNVGVRRTANSMGNSRHDKSFHIMLFTKVEKSTPIDFFYILINGSENFCLSLPTKLCKTYIYCYKLYRGALLCALMVGHPFQADSDSV